MNLHDNSTYPPPTTITTTPPPPTHTADTGAPASVPWGAGAALTLTVVGVGVLGLVRLASSRAKRFREGG